MRLIKWKCDIFLFSVISHCDGVLLTWGAGDMADHGSLWFQAKKQCS